MTNGITLPKFHITTPPPSIILPKKTGIYTNIHSCFKSLYDLFMRALKRLFPCIKTAEPPTESKLLPPPLNTKVSLGPPPQNKPEQSNELPVIRLVSPANTKIKSLEARLEQINIREAERKAKLEQLDAKRKVHKESTLAQTQYEEKPEYMKCKEQLENLAKVRIEQKLKQEQIDRKLKDKLNHLETKIETIQSHKPIENEKHDNLEAEKKTVFERLSSQEERQKMAETNYLEAKNKTEKSFESLRENIKKTTSTMSAKESSEKSS